MGKIKGINIPRKLKKEFRKVKEIQYEQTMVINRPRKVLVAFRPNIKMNGQTRQIVNVLVKEERKRYATMTKIEIDKMQKNSF